MDEENFPRGGVVKSVEKKVKIQKEANQDLFKDAVDTPIPKDKKRQTEGDEDGVKSEILFSNKKNKIKDKDTVHDPKRKKKKDVSHIPQKLLFKNVCNSMLLMGYVEEINDYGLLMALPNGRRGEVPITKISSAYTQCLQQFSGSSDGKSTGLEVLHSLAELFKVGSLLPCQVQGSKTNSLLPQLSVNPRNVNAALSKDSLTNNTIFHGSISSCEDTGYIVDTGVYNTSGFLKNKEALQYIEKCNDGKRLKVGQLVRCRILEQKKKRKSTDGNYIPVTIDPDQLNEPIQKNSIEFSDLVPGMRVTANIQQIMKPHGLVVSFINHTSLIHVSHVPSSLSTFSVGDKIECCVLHITPEKQSVVLTALPHIVNYNGNPVHLFGFGNLYVGSYVREAKVSHTKSKGVFVKLEGKASGLADLNNLEEDTKYQKGTHVRCVVTSIDYEANKVQVSFKRNVITELIQPSDLIGDVFTAYISSAQPNKPVLVRIMGKFKGRLTKSQLDHGLTYKRGEQVECRVLSETTNDFLLVSNKPWAVQAEYPIVTEVDQLQVNQALDAFVLFDRRRDVKVSSYGQLKGLAPKLWTEEGIERNRGDHVVCRVMRYDKSQRDGLILGLQSDSEEMSIPGEAFGAIIGPNGSKIKDLQRKTSTHILLRDGGMSWIYGSKDCRDDMKEELLKIIEQVTSTENYPLNGKRGNSESSEGPDAKKLKVLPTVTITIPKSLTGRVIGARGVIINKIQEDTGTKVSVIPDYSDPNVRLCVITGTEDAISEAKQKILQLVEAPDDNETTLDKLKASKKANQDVTDPASLSKRQRSASASSGDETGSSEKPSDSKKQKLLTTGTIAIPKSLTGNRVIGARGVIINKIQEDTGTKVSVIPDDSDPNVRLCVITGTEDAISEAKQKILQLVEAPDDNETTLDKLKASKKANQDVTDSTSLSKRQRSASASSGDETGGSEKPSNSKKQKLLPTEELSIPHRIIGRVIGLKGVKIKDIQKQTKATLKVKLDECDPNTNVCVITGTEEAIEKAKKKILELAGVDVTKFDQRDITVKIEDFSIPTRLVSKVIGVKGVRLQKIQKDTGTTVYIKLDEGDHDNNTVTITGTKEGIRVAKETIQKAVDEFGGNQTKLDQLKRSEKPNETIVEISIPNKDVGKVIGKRGSTITNIRYETGAKVIIEKGAEEGEDKTWMCTVTGTQDATTKAKDMIYGFLNGSQISDSQIVTEEISIPDNYVGKILGKGGKTIDKIRSKSGARVYLKESEIEGASRLCCISGSQAAVTKAKGIVEGRMTVNVKSDDKAEVEEEQQQEVFESSDSEEEREPDETVEVTISVPSACIQRVLKSKMFKKLQTASPAKVSLTQDDDQEEGVCTIAGTEEDVMKAKTKVEKILKKAVSKGNKAKPTLQLTSSLTWDTQLKLPNKHKDDSSSDEAGDEEIHKPVKKSKAEKRKEKNEEEKRIYEYERKKLEGEIIPETADDFDRLVINSPNSSVVWLRYMAFHLETSEIDKARAIANRALKTISFREEREKQNIWVAFLNLENMYGTSETIGKVLARAIKQCEPLDIYLPLVNMYVESSKLEEAERLYSIMVKKYSGNKIVWPKFGEFYFQQSRQDSARKLLQRALKSLDDRDHVEIITKFAQLEFKYGEPERGKTMFENVLSTYPKRTDVWSVYVELLTKLKDHSVTRGIYNRMIGLHLPAKKIKFFFKKYLKFEEKFGNETQIADVKQKALEYVESGGLKQVKAE